MAADHPVEFFRGVDVPVDLSPHQLHRVDRHQLDLEEVRALVEHEVVLQPLDDLLKEFPFLIVQALIGPDAVGHGVQVVRLGAGALGWLGDPLCTVPAVQVLLVFLV